jgi:homoserine kinase
LRARAPASAANLGPGFDTLALALGRYVEVEVRPSDAFHLETHGLGAHLPTDHSHLAARVVGDVLGHDSVHLSVSSDIPVSRGLGSSAALALAAAAAAGADDPLAVAARFDGHAENAAASFRGGLVAASVVEGRPVVRQLRLDDGLRFVVVVPERELRTSEARGLLPSVVPLEAAVQNLGRLALLIAGLGDRSQLLRAAGSDRLHQDARRALFPEAPALIGALEDGGAVVACWSGAGPSMLGICVDDEAARRAVESATAALARLGLTGEASVVAADLHGLVVTPD